MEKAPEERAIVTWKFEKLSGVSEQQGVYSNLCEHGRLQYLPDTYWLLANIPPERGIHTFCNKHVVPLIDEERMTRRRTTLQVKYIGYKVDGMARQTF